MTASMNRIVVSLDLPTRIPALIGVADAILLAMTGNPAFPKPDPSLSKVSTALEQLRKAQVV